MLLSLSIWTFLTNYDITCRKLNHLLLYSIVQKRLKIRAKQANGDYLFYLQIKKLQIIAKFVQFKMALVPELVKCVTKSGSAQTRMVVQKLWKFEVTNLSPSCIDNSK